MSQVDPMVEAALQRLVETGLPGQRVRVEDMMDFLEHQGVLISWQGHGYGMFPECFSWAGVKEKMGMI